MTQWSSVTQVSSCRAWLRVVGEDHPALARCRIEWSRRSLERGEPNDALAAIEPAAKARQRLWQIGLSVFERYQGKYTEEMKPFVETMLYKRVGIAVHVDRVVSWDHSKLNMGS